MDIAYYLYLRSKGKPVKEHPVIAQLFKVRTYIEKMMPLEKKMRGEIEKLIKIPHASGDNASELRPSLRANADNFDVPDDDGGTPIFLLRSSLVGSDSCSPRKTTHHTCSSGLMFKSRGKMNGQTHSVGRPSD